MKSFRDIRGRNRDSESKQERGGKKITGEECVFPANVVFKAPVLAIVYINR